MSTNALDFEVLRGSEGKEEYTCDVLTFTEDPVVNVISKEVLEERIQKVFKLLWEKLSKSFGPYGAPSIIVNYPYRQMTKDGYTIFKNLSMDAKISLVDQVIANMAGDICGRLNYAVGDGTTTAIIATYSIYNNYMKNKDLFDKFDVLPRDIIKKFNEFKIKVIDKLRNKVRVIQSDDLKELEKNIYDVVYVSSNADETITSYISELYGELGCPAISCEVSPDGVNRKELIEGYKVHAMLNDRLYINSDDDTMKLDEADIVIVSTKVTESLYKRILKPLNEQSRMRGRKLIVIASLYDEVALRQTISMELNNEYRQTNTVNMVLMTYSATSTHKRQLISDFSVLANTTIIDRTLERMIYDQLDEGQEIHEIFNFDNRNIKGLKSLAYNYATHSCREFITGVDNIENMPGYVLPTLNENSIDVGYAKNLSLGLRTSIIETFFYNKEKYDILVTEAKTAMESTIAKYKKLGTFNIEVSQATQRYYSLKLKMGLIQIGGESELSQRINVDAADDAVKAAISAYNQGVVKGCNVSLIQSIFEAITEELNENDVEEVDLTIMEILYDGFCDVYKTVLRNAYKTDYTFGKSVDTVSYENFVDTTNTILKIKPEDDFKTPFTDVTATLKVIEKMRFLNDGEIPLFDAIVEYSRLTGLVFDVSKKEFSDKIINSVQTDEEVLTATIDLIALLIVGNQMVVTGKDGM